MNAKWFGDSYDIVKRFFLDIAKAQGYSVQVDPMFTGDWNDSSRAAFLIFVDFGQPLDASAKRAALFVDPDTGIGKRSSPKHTTIAAVALQAKKYDLVIIFDQAFSWSIPVVNELQRKLLELRGLGVHAFYYDSHARFLFCSRRLESLESFHQVLLDVGLPSARLIWANPVVGTGGAEA